MAVHILDNPIWEALASTHGAFALRHGDVARYPPEVAPFVAVRAAGVDASAALDLLVAPGDKAFLLGPKPAVSAQWSLRGPVMLAQMLCAEPVAEVEGPAMIALSEVHRADVLALTALVYPHYFRARTPDLGRYFGIYVEGRLAAMAGERMRTHTCTEISAICTHPDFLGRGYARRLTAMLANDVLARGLTPFLHVSQENLRALDLYRRNGFELRCEMPFWSLRRSAECTD